MKELVRWRGWGRGCCVFCLVKQNRVVGGLGDVDGRWGRKLKDLYEGEKKCSFKQGEYFT